MPSRPKRPPARPAAPIPEVREIERHVYAVDRAELLAAMPTSDGLRRQARLIPYFEDSVFGGVKIIGVRPATVFRALRFRSGDIIRRVGDQQPELDSLHQLLVDAFACAEELEISMRRGGEDQVVRFRISGKPEMAIPISDELRAAIRAVSEHERDIDRAPLQEALADDVPLAELTEIESVSGPEPGLLVARVPPCGFHALLGLQSGDVLTHVDGDVVTHAGFLVLFYERLRNADVVKLGVKRDGKSLTLDFRVR